MLSKRRKTQRHSTVIKFSLIGMSGAGKSYWTRKLAGAGFRTIGIDDAIERKLAPQLAEGDYRGVGGVAAWMGWPDQPAYREREKMYLACEVEAMREALDEIEFRSSSEGIVLDTTGSVVYTGEDICRRLRRLTTVAYLEASADEQELLVDRYLSDPKPVLWADQFSRAADESTQAAIARCYRSLIAQRKALYERLAHQTIPMAEFRNAALDARGFLERVDTHSRSAVAYREHTT
jgi:shikimate kinase